MKDGENSTEGLSASHSSGARVAWAIFTILMMLLTAAFVIASGLFFKNDHDPLIAPSASLKLSKTPMTAVAERFECPVYLQKHISWLGKEDGFDRSNQELARPRDAVLRQAFFEHVYSGKNRRYRYRDYDELGVDRELFDTVEFPSNIVSGFVVARVIVDDPRESDFLAFSDLTDEFTNVPTSTHRRFFAPLRAASMEAIGGSEEALISINFDEFVSRVREEGRTLSEYFNGPEFEGKDSGPTLEITVSDDTSVDAMAVVSCVKKPNRFGTTFSEITFELDHSNFSLLSCAMDINQRPCDPFTGDTACEVALPVACYSSNFVEASGMDDQLSEETAARLARFRVDGQIRPSTAVKGYQFQTREDVNAFCRAQFGSDFRVLSFHESGAPGILSRSNIEPGQRLWVDVRDQPEGNCWKADVDDGPSSHATFGGGK